MPRCVTPTVHSKPARSPAVSRYTHRTRAQPPTVAKTKRPKPHKRPSPNPSNTPPRHTPTAKTSRYRENTGEYRTRSLHTGPDAPKPHARRPARLHPQACAPALTSSQACSVALSRVKACTVALRVWPAHPALYTKKLPNFPFFLAPALARHSGPCPVLSLTPLSPTRGLPSRQALSVPLSLAGLSAVRVSIPPGPESARFGVAGRGAALLSAGLSAAFSEHVAPLFIAHFCVSRPPVWYNGLVIRERERDGRNFQSQDRAAKLGPVQHGLLQL